MKRQNTFLTPPPRRLCEVISFCSFLTLVASVFASSNQTPICPPGQVLNTADCTCKAPPPPPPPAPAVSKNWICGIYCEAYSLQNGGANAFTHYERNASDKNTAESRCAQSGVNDCTDFDRCDCTRCTEALKASFSVCREK